MELERLMIFCKSTSFDECVQILKTKLSKKIQVEHYDFIYDRFVSETNLENFDVNLVIPGLENVIELMILSQIYKHQLFPKYVLEFEITDDQRDEIQKYLSIENFSIKSFMETSAKLCAIFDDLLSGGRKYGINISNFPTNRFCFPYILLHKAGNLSFGSVVSMLFENPTYSKLPISFKFYNDLIGPHGGFFEKPYMFFDHDTDHIKETLSNIANYNVNAIISKLHTLQKGTFERRFIEIYLHVIFFEERLYREINYRETGDAIDYTDCVEIYTYNNINPFERFYEIKQILIDTFDLYDMCYIFKYLFESYDLNQYTDNLELLTINFIAFNEKYNKIRHLLKEVERDYIFLKENEDKVFDHEKYSSVIDVNVEDNVGFVADKLDEKAKEMIDDFFEACFGPIIFQIIV